MNAFSTEQHFMADTCVLDVAVIANDGARDGYCPLGVVRRFANPLFAFPVADVSRNDGAGHSFETCDAARVPAQHVRVRQQFRLFPDCITSRDSFEAANHSFGDRQGR
jgi:hypothetical protein